VKLSWYDFHELSVDLLHDILLLRQDVFVIEQNCPYDDIDGRDKNSWHLLGEDEDGEMVAYLRLTKPGYKYAEPAIGRVVTARKVRRTGAGAELMREGIRKSEELHPGSPIRISAQVYAKGFYAQFGFEPVGEPYDEDGILHIVMLRPYRNNR
jgi:ElaA protein